MKFLKNTIGFLSVFCIVPSVFAVTARPAAIGIGNAVMGVSAAGAARRMPGSSAKVTPGDVVPSSLLDNIECIDAYMECIESDDACGSDFSECTTNVLFHAQMPDCISTLAQCAPDGINSLFGTSSTTALSGVAEYNDDKEIVRYTYPTDGSVMGQKIIAARIENMYDDQTCVKRYTNCLKRDDVCGENFELCSGTRSFKKQALNCDTHLSRCSMSGVRKMFGDNVKNKNLNGMLNDDKNVPLTIDALSSVGGSIATLIDEGSDYVAANAVSSCYKKVDACIAGACKKNPLRCIEGTSIAAVQAAQGVSGGALGSDLAGSSDTLTASQINRYLRTTCADEIGGLDACHITYFGKKPKASDLTNPEIVDEVFVMAHNDRKSSLESKIQGFLQEFDTEAKNKCQETVMQCVMRTCGGGSGAACYSKVFSAAGENTINGPETYDEIARGCASVANTDPNCLYAYQDVAGDEYSYMYITEDAFTTLFPKKSSSSGDPIGLVAALNSSLSLNYNDAAIANMKKQCQNVATSCVRSFCGTDYVNCYRNRTDVMSTLTSTNDDAFNKSMNKVGGVLDYTIVLGLCSETVKNASSCEEHLAIEMAKIKSHDSEYVQAWGGQSTVRGGWYDAGGANQMDLTAGVQVTDANGKKMCYADNGAMGECDTVDASGNIYDAPAMQSYDTYAQSEATTSLFRELLYDLEKEAQAKYNAKLTKEQNECLAANNGGIMGQNDLGSTYMWAKLKSNKVPADYSSQGLKANQFVASNELYGSFCRLKVTVHSDDINILNALNGTLVTKDAKNKDNFTTKSMVNKDWATRYFAVGDTFVCGSWIPQQALMEIANAVGKNARADKQATQPKIAGWMSALGAIGLGTGGAFLGDAIQDKAATGVFGTKNSAKKAQDTKTCQELADDYSDKKTKMFAEVFLDRLDNKSETKEARKWVQLADKNNFSDTEFKKITEKDFDPEVTGSAPNVACRTKDFHKLNDDKNACIKDVEKVKEKAQDKAADAIYDLVALCEVQEEEDSNNWWKTYGGETVGAAVGAVGGGLLGYYITDSIQKAQLDKAEQEAITEFMENVGSKIQCYVGPDFVGTYGQPVPTSME